MGGIKRAMDLDRADPIMFPSREAGHLILIDTLVLKAGDNLNGEGFPLGSGDHGGNVLFFVIINGGSMIHGSEECVTEWH